MTLHTNDINKQIAETIRIERIKKGYSQEYLSLRLDISQNAYSRIEQGRTKINVERLLQIASILEIDIDVLLSSLS